jgi:hypothetical protein
MGESHVVIGGDVVVKAVGNSRVKSMGHSRVSASAHATVEAILWSFVSASGYSVVTAKDYVMVVAESHSRITARGTAVVHRLYGDATVELSERAICWDEVSPVPEDPPVLRVGDLAGAISTLWTPRGTREPNPMIDDPEGQWEW